jgi:hypothetical protein
MASESSAHPGLSLDHCCRDALPGGYMTRLQAAAQGIKRALLFVGATALAVSIIIFLRILLTATSCRAGTTRWRTSCRSSTDR